MFSTIYMRNTFSHSWYHIIERRRTWAIEYILGLWFIKKVHIFFKLCAKSLPYVWRQLLILFINHCYESSISCNRSLSVCSDSAIQGIIFLRWIDFLSCVLIETYIISVFEYSFIKGYIPQPAVAMCFGMGRLYNASRATHF